MKKLITALIAIVMGGFMMAAPVFAERCRCSDGSEGVKTTIMGGSDHCVCDNGSGDSIVNIFKLVVNIVSVAIGILGAIGIAVVGIQYLTAGGNEEQTRKSKRRLFELIIGLVAYVVAYGLLSWLLPGFQ